MALKKILLAAVLGAAAIAVPVGTAQAAGEVIPAANAASVSVGPSMSDADSGWVSVSYQNTNTVPLSVVAEDTSPTSGCVSMRIYDASGTALTPLPISVYNLYSPAVPAGGSARVVFGCLPQGTATLSVYWAVGDRNGAALGWSNDITAVVPGGGTAATMELVSVSGDSGAKDGTATFKVCLPANSDPDEQDAVIMGSMIALPVGLSGCTTATFRGLTYSTQYTATLSTNYAADRFPRIAVTVPFTPKALAVPGAPGISGTFRVLGTVKVTGLTFSPKPTSITYQWYRNGKAISKANSTSYQIQQADYNTRLSVSATAMVDGRKVTRSASSFKQISPGPKVPRVSAPYQSGVPKTGMRLAISKGQWKASGVSAKYQWLRNGKAISKATGTSYRLTGADTNTRISVRVTVTAKGFASNTFTTGGSKIWP